MSAWAVGLVAGVVLIVSAAAGLALGLLLLYVGRVAWLLWLFRLPR